MTIEEFDLEQIGEREMNARLQALTGQGARAILKNTHARHNIAVNVKGELEIEALGSAGFYCCGFMNGPDVTINGNVGWYAADNMLGGSLVVTKNAGSNFAPSMIGGVALVRGASGSRVGYGLKGGTVVVCGDVGMLTGQQMMNGRIVLLGKVGVNTGESMYGGAIYHRKGMLAGMGGNIRSRPIEAEEESSLAELFARYDIAVDPKDLECLTPKSGKQKFQIFKPQHRQKTEEAA